MTPRSIQRFLGSVPRRIAIALPLLLPPALGLPAADNSVEAERFHPPEIGYFKQGWMHVVLTTTNFDADYERLVERGTDAKAEVRIDAGAVSGLVDNGVLSFKGVPYAQPPVGALRWKAPPAATALDPCF